MVKNQLLPKPCQILTPFPILVSTTRPEVTDRLDTGDDSVKGELNRHEKIMTDQRSKTRHAIDRCPHSTCGPELI